MKLITRDTDYAIRALVCIAQHQDKVVTVKQLVHDLKIPLPFLRKILQILNKKKILRSHKGKGGGFSSMVSPEELLLIDVIEAFQGRLLLNECRLKKKPCPNIKTCELRRRINKIQTYVLCQLSNITIRCLIKK